MVGTVGLMEVVGTSIDVGMLGDSVGCPVSLGSFVVGFSVAREGAFVTGMMTGELVGVVVGAVVTGELVGELVGAVVTGALVVGAIVGTPVGLLEGATVVGSTVVGLLVGNPPISIA